MVDRVGWGSAFGKGAVIFLWMILWIIVGVIITVLIAGAGLIAVVQNPTSITNPLAFLGTIFLGLIVGELFITIAIYATIVRTAANAAIAKIEREMQLYQQPKPTEKPGY